MEHVCVQWSPLPAVLLSAVSVTHSQRESENIQWKIPEIHNSQVLSCSLFSGVMKPPASFHTTPHPESPCCINSRSYGHQVNRSTLAIITTVFKSLLFYLLMTPNHKSSDAGNLNMPKRSRKMLPLSEKERRERKEEQFFNHSSDHGNAFNYQFICWHTLLAEMYLQVGKITNEPNQLQIAKPARKNRQTLRNNNAHYACSRSCQTLITGQALTPLVSYGGNAKSESRHFQDFKSLVVQDQMIYNDLCKKRLL
ncbi:uncharacterized protein RBU33_024821 isoform 2-T2 [Hipposideros larvatus]